MTIVAVLFREINLELLPHILSFEKMIIKICDTNFPRSFTVCWRIHTKSQFCTYVTGLRFSRSDASWLRCHVLRLPLRPAIQKSSHTCEHCSLHRTPGMGVSLLRCVKLPVSFGYVGWLGMIVRTDVRLVECSRRRRTSTISFLGAAFLFPPSKATVPSEMW